MRRKVDQACAPAPCGPQPGRPALRRPVSKVSSHLEGWRQATEWLQGWTAGGGWVRSSLGSLRSRDIARRALSRCKRLHQPGKVEEPTIRLVVGRPKFVNVATQTKQ